MPQPPSTIISSPRSAIPTPHAAMATTVAPPSPSSPVTDDASIPTATLALPSIAAAPRRLPPPCWSPDETSALIDAYRDKWYSLRRGNLRANHWQEVASDVAVRCPASPPKTAVQCRHKMEKLRKRYRGEIQRSAAHGGPRRHSSSWDHFQRMHAMERGPNPSPPSSSSSPSPPSSDDEHHHKNTSSIKRVNDLYTHHHHNRGVFGEINGSANVRIKIPGRVPSAPNPNNPYNPRLPNFAPATINGNHATTRKRAGEAPNMNRGSSGMSELVAAIHSMGEGFMRMEKMKMEMARQMEEMRMEMELKRTEMIIESEQRILQAFSNAITDTLSKRAKYNPPEN